MPENEVRKRAQEDARKGKSASRQAGEFVREEMHHVREGEHGARSTRQIIAIGLSKARRAGVKLPPPKKAKVSSGTRRQAKHDLETSRQKAHHAPSRTRSRAIHKALEREGHQAASSKAVAAQARESARKRGPAARHSAAMKAIHTKGRKGLQRAARKAGRTRSED